MKNERGPRPGSFITAIYRCRDTPRSTKLSKLCREVNSPRGTSLNRLFEGNSCPTSFQDLIISRNCVHQQRTSPFLSIRGDRHFPSFPITWIIPTSNLWKVNDEDRWTRKVLYVYYREGKERRDWSGKKCLCWIGEINIVEKGRVLCVYGKREVKVQMVSLLDLGEEEGSDKYVVCVCMKKRRRSWSA